MTDKLDHETESVIEEFAVEEWLSGKKMTNHASDARDAVRQRIRVLVEEARKEEIAFRNERERNAEIASLSIKANGS